MAQLVELVVVDAELFGAVGWDLLLDRAPIGEGADRDALATGRALEHLTRAVEQKVIRDDKARDDSFTQSPACFDHALIGPGHRILCEHDASDIGIEKGLHDDGNAWAGEEADALSVRDGRVRVRRPPHLPQRVGHRFYGRDVEQREVLAGEELHSLHRLGGAFRRRGRVRALPG